MSVFSNEIDLNVFQRLVEAHADALPRETLYALLQATQAWERNEPNADRTLCNLIAENPHIDQAYTNALADLRKGYVAQEKAKNVILIPNQPFNDRQDWTRSLIPKLEALLLEPYPNLSVSDAKVENLEDHFDRTAIMGAGGAFLGSALAQLFGGGILHLIGAIIGAIVGISYGLSLLNPTNRPRRRS
jgi:hypothetical protein